MPLEIKELIIKLTIDQDNGDGSQASTAPSSPGQPDPALVEACVEKVLETLKRQQER